MNTFLTIAPLAVGSVILIALLWLRLRTAEHVHARLQTETDQERTGEEDRGDRAHDPVSLWLYRAGFRGDFASTVFYLATGGMLLLGIVFLAFVFARGAVAQAADLATAIPGGVGNVLVPFILAAPWFLVVFIALLPTLVVRSARRRRVREIEQDLPLFLDLLNTLAQAGIGFDSALDRVLSAQAPTRPLVQEMRGFQYDTLAGRTRVESLRRLMRRVEVPMFTTFISAVIQAEQVGAGMAQTLRVQAAEMRGRRRETAAAAAMAVPTKLVIPMVVGFLPGTFIVLVGPMLHEAFGVMGQTMRGITGQ